MPESVSSVSFTMHGSREVLELSGHALLIERQIITIEEAVVKNPSLAFDLSRSLLETICKTILKERGIDPETLGFNELLKRTETAVSLVPATHSAKQDVLESLQKILDGLDTLIWGLTGLRNAEGMASHGKPADAPQLDSAQAQLAARAADAVVCYLYKAHKNYNTPPLVPRLEFDDNPDFNTHIDENNDPVKIFDLEYQPSDVLFNVDQEAYRDLLKEFQGQNEQPQPVTADQA